MRALRGLEVLCDDSLIRAVSKIQAKISRSMRVNRTREGIPRRRTFRGCQKTTILASNACAFRLLDPNERMMQAAQVWEPRDRASTLYAPPKWRILAQSE